MAAAPPSKLPPTATRGVGDATLPRCEAYAYGSNAPSLVATEAEPPMADAGRDARDACTRSMRNGGVGSAAAPAEVVCDDVGRDAPLRIVDADAENDV